MEPMAYLALSVVIFCFLVMIFTRIGPDFVLMGGVTILLLTGVLSPSEALSGFSNEGMITVAMLYIVAKGVSQTGAAAWVAGSFLGRPRSIGLAQLRLMLPVAGLSSLVNNTPVVAMMIPAVIDWAKRNQFSVSQLLIPLSYAAIIGGSCTLIGTSTNLVVDGMLKGYSQIDNNLSDYELGVFDLAWIGIPCAFVTFIFVFFFSRFLLPKNNSLHEKHFADTREYTVEMSVEAGSYLSGKTIEEAGLRNLPGVFLVEIQRNGQLLTAVAPTQKLFDNDRLVFVGNVESVVDLQKMRGLVPAENQIFKLDSQRSQRNLVELVISNSFPQLNKTVKEGRFRSTYGAAIIAVAREGQRITGRIGDIVLKPGDTLLIEADSTFERQQRYARDFLLVRKIDDYTPISHEHMGRALIIFVSMVLLAGTGVLSMLEASMLGAAGMILAKCTRASETRSSIDWQVLIVIGASIALGLAIEKTGAAATLANIFIDLVGQSPRSSLALLFILTAGFSALISNVAAAVLLFPVALAISNSLEINMLPLAITLMIAASASFSTPIGYQTNLMVYGPGKYRFVDFMKMGIPLTVLVGLITVLLVPLVWSF